MFGIRKKIEKVLNRGEKVLSVYFPAGFPDSETSEYAIDLIAKSGADIIEIGIPFSDPLADGKTIQKASEISLRSGFRVSNAFGIAERAKSANTDVHFIFMTYYNILVRIGEEKFIKTAKNCGVDGLIIPDLPPEESETITEISKNNEMSTVFLVAPTSTKERIKLIDEKTTGFIYYVSVKGVTGARDKLPEDIAIKIQNLKNTVKNYVIVGFGISKKEQVKEICRISDGVILGSVIIDMFLSGLERKEISNFINNIKEACC